MKIYDISRPIAKGEPVYPGNPKPALKRIKVFSRDKSNLSEISLGLHTASHLDGPLHYLKRGVSIEKIKLEKCLGWARVVDMTKVERGRGIEERQIKPIKPKKGEIILFKTKNSSPSRSRHFNKNFVHITESAAKALIKSRIKAVGIDGPSIRKFRLKPDTVHPLLLKAGVLIYEGLNLRNIRPGRYFFIGLPLKINGAEASPVRAILVK